MDISTAYYLISFRDQYYICVWSFTPCLLVTVIPCAAVCLPLEFAFAERIAVTPVKVRLCVMDSSEQAPFLSM